MVRTSLNIVKQVKNKNQNKEEENSNNKNQWPHKAKPAYNICNIHVLSSAMRLCCLQSAMGRDL